MITSHSAAFLEAKAPSVGATGGANGTAGGVKRFALVCSKTASVRCLVRQVQAHFGAADASKIRVWYVPPPPVAVTAGAGAGGVERKITPQSSPHTLRKAAGTDATVVLPKPIMAADGSLLTLLSRDELLDLTLEQLQLGAFEGGSVLYVETRLRDGSWRSSTRTVPGERSFERAFDMLLKQSHIGHPGRLALVPSSNTAATAHRDSRAVIASVAGANNAPVPRNSVTAAAGAAATAAALSPATPHAACGLSYPQTGLVGLTNLGNTCFMSTALQCVSHTTLLTNYMFADLYLKEVKRLGR